MKGPIPRLNACTLHAQQARQAGRCYRGSACAYLDEYVAEGQDDYEADIQEGHSHQCNPDRCVHLHDTANRLSSADGRHEAQRKHASMLRPCRHDLCAAKLTGAPLLLEPPLPSLPPPPPAHTTSRLHLGARCGCQIPPRASRAALCGCKHWCSCTPGSLALRRGIEVRGLRCLWLQQAWAGLLVACAAHVGMPSDQRTRHAALGCPRAGLLLMACSADLYRTRSFRQAALTASTTPD